MSDIAIRVQNLSKLYRIGQRESYCTLRDTLVNAWKTPFRFFRAEGGQSSNNTIWALKDVSFEIKRGEIIGIIGRNGAGKTTLLKILSRITRPTKGQAEVHGRVGSLLEVGTGFHPELTGRENIFLNGAILGMKKREIEHKFDEIVSFAETEKFLDTPVKRYSSGMYMRLAFAVAAHLEPEILLVDEVLAVGDAEFQKKCLGKMGDVAKEGRTVLFVSHNMGAISRLCGRSFLLDKGKLIKDAPSTQVISEYIQPKTKTKHHFLQPANPSISLCLIEASVFSEDDLASDVFPRQNPITIQMTYKANREIFSAHVYSNITTPDGTVVLGTSDTDTDQSRFGPRAPGTYICQYQVPANTLNEGIYNVNISLGVPYQINFQENDGLLTFSVMDVKPSGRMIHHSRAGVIWLDIPWRYLNGSPFPES